MKLDQDEINNIQNDLYFTLRQTEGLVNLMIGSECFLSSNDERISDIQSTLEVCKERIEKMRDLQEKNETYIKCLLSDMNDQKNITVRK